MKPHKFIETKDGGGMFCEYCAVRLQYGFKNESDFKDKEKMSHFASALSLIHKGCSCAPELLQVGEYTSDTRFETKSPQDLLNEDNVHDFYSLMKYLSSNGYRDDDALQISMIYHCSKQSALLNAMNHVVDWDDEEHVYTEELMNYILEWEKEKNETNNN